jgi:hypothetical protein
MKTCRLTVGLYVLTSVLTYLTTVANLIILT